jgi:hypothetical protein
LLRFFFSFGKYKHCLIEYDQWPENLLSYTENPKVILTSKEISPLVKRLSDARSLIVSKLVRNCFPIVIITDFDTPWEMAPIKIIKDALISQVDMDGEEQIHSLDLYAIWNAKAWMLEYVALQNPFKTAYFLCVDTGAFRSTKYRFGSWQNHRKAVQIFQKDGPQKLLLDLINRLPQKVCAKPRTGSTQNNLEHGPISQDLVEGTVFGGSSESIRWWSKLYYTTIHLYIRRKLFVKKD